jgi:hypothetical protein
MCSRVVRHAAGGSGWAMACLIVESLAGGALPLSFGGTEMERKASQTGDCASHVRAVCWPRIAEQLRTRSRGLKTDDT